MTYSIPITEADRVARHASARAIVSRLGAPQLRKAAREIGVSPWFYNEKGVQTYLRKRTLRDRCLNAVNANLTKACWIIEWHTTGHASPNDPKVAEARKVWQADMKRILEEDLRRKFSNRGFAADDSSKAKTTGKGTSTIDDAIGDAEKPEPKASPREATSENGGRALTGALEALIVDIVRREGVNEEHVQKLVEKQLGEIKDLIRERPKRITVITPDKVERKLGLTHKQFPQLLQYAQATGDGTWVNIWVAGPAGSGKSHAGRQVAEALGREFRTNGAVDLEHKLMGYEDANGVYRTTPFHDAFTKPCVYVFDEVDRSHTGALLAFDGALANGHCDFPGSPGGVPRHEQCVIIACGNTFGYGATSEYVGAAPIDGAFIDRFVQIEWEYDEALERAVAGNDEIVSRVQTLRAKAKAAGLKVIISPRASIYASRLVAVGVKPADAIHAAVFAKLNPQDRKALEV